MMALKAKLARNGGSECLKVNNDSEHLIVSDGSESQEWWKDDDDSECRNREDGDASECRNWEAMMALNAKTENDDGSEHRN